VKRETKSDGAKASGSPSEGTRRSPSPNGDGPRDTARMQEIRRLIDAAESLPDVRVDVVGRLREMVQAGQYKVDERAVALRLIEEYRAHDS